MSEAARYSTAARYALGAIRILNGAAALVAPSLISGRLRLKEGEAAAASYPLRLFGVRTVLIGADLFRAEGEHLDKALREAPYIHASDTVAAALTGVTGSLPRRTSIMLTGISLINTALSIVARRGFR